MGCCGGGGRGCVFAREMGAGPVVGVPGHIMGCRRERAGLSRFFFFPFKRRCRGGSHFPFSGGSGERGAGVRSRVRSWEGTRVGKAICRLAGASGPADVSLRRLLRRLRPQLLRGRAVPLPGWPQDGSGLSSPALQPPRRCPQPRPTAAPHRTPAGLSRPRPAPPPGRRCPPPPPCAAQPRSGRGRLSGAAEPARPFVCGRAGAVLALQCQPGAGWGC